MSKQFYWLHKDTENIRRDCDEHELRIVLTHKLVRSGCNPDQAPGIAQGQIDEIKKVSPAPVPVSELSDVVYREEPESVCPE